MASCSSLSPIHTHPWPEIAKSNSDIIYQELNRLNDGTPKFDEQTLRQIANDIATFACAETTTDFPEKIAALFTQLQELASKKEELSPKALSIKVCEAIGARFLTERSNDLLAPSSNIHRFTDAIELPENYTFTANRSIRLSVATLLNQTFCGTVKLDEVQRYFNEGHFIKLLNAQAIRVDFTSAQPFVLTNKNITRTISQKKIKATVPQKVGKIPSKIPPKETKACTLITIVEKCDAVSQATFIGNPNQTGPIVADFSIPESLNGVYDLTITLKVIKADLKLSNLGKRDVIKCSNITGNFSIEDSSRRRVNFDGKTYYLDWDNITK